MATSRVRFWAYDPNADSGAGGWDYLDVAPCQPIPHDNNPTIEEQTRLGRTVLVVPADTSEAAGWADTVEFVFHRRKCFTLNTPPTGGTSRNLSEWFRHYVRDKQAEPDWAVGALAGADLFVYVDSYGKDAAGAGVHTTTYYKGWLRPPLPPWLVDAPAALDRGDEYLRLTLIVDQTSGEGTVPDFDQPPDQTGPTLTPRTVS